MRGLIYHGWRWLRSLVALAAVVQFAPAVEPTDAALAVADRATLPLDRQPFAYYVSTAAIDEDWRSHAGTALRLVLPSMSRQPILERCSPVQVGETLFRIDLADLGWDLATWADVIGDYPYRLGTVQPDGSRLSLTLRADWLLVQLTDAHASDAYYRLVFGNPVPKTRDEALSRLGVNQDAKLQFGLIEGASGVSVQGTRLVRNLAAARGYAWGTADVLALSPQQDPLEQPEGDFPHDGEEWIVGVPKLHLASGTRGALQVYFLANGQGQIVDRAPVDLVRDHAEFRGFAEIRTAGSCIGCHLEGLNPFKRNEVRSALTAGVNVLPEYGPERDALERFHFADLDKELRRNNEDYAAIVELACGCDPDEASFAFQTVVSEYDKPVTLEIAARELGADANELSLALGRSSALGVPLGWRLSSLAHGQSVPRVAWEQSYLTVEALLNAWRNAP